MNSWRKHTVIGLVICPMQLSLADVALAADTTVPNPSLTRQRVDQFGVGAKVKVELSNGKKFKGSVQSIEDGGFLLALAKAGSPTRVPYGEITQLNLTKNTYKATGQPDSVEVKTRGCGMGEGHHIQVKTAAGKEYHGSILSVGTEQFTMLPDHQAAPVEIAYSQTLRMGPNLSKGAKIAIVVIVGLAIVAVIVSRPWRSE